MRWTAVGEVSLFRFVLVGYLPSYWIALRMINVPAINTTLFHSWPVAFGGLSHVTVGLLATFITALCIAAADIGAYFVGKAFGK